MPLSCSPDFSVSPFPLRQMWAFSILPSSSPNHSENQHFKFPKRDIILSHPRTLALASHCLEYFLLQGSLLLTWAPMPSPILSPHPLSSLLWHLLTVALQSDPPLLVNSPTEGWWEVGG